MTTDVLFETHQSPLWIVDRSEAAVLACNAAARRLTGVPEEDHRRLGARRLGLVRQDGPSRIVSQDGQPVETLLSWSKIDWLGAPAFLVMAMSGPTEPVAEIERLRRRHEMIDRALAAVQGVLLEADLTTGRLRFSSDSLSALGLPGLPQELSIPDLMDLIHPEDVARYRAERADSIANGELLDTSLRIVRPDGEIRHVRVVSGTAPEGDIRYSLLQDRTELVRMGEQQRQTRAILDLASGMAKLGGWRTDVRTGRTDLTPGVHQIYAMPAGSFHTQAAYSCYAPADRRILRDAQVRALRGETFNGEFAITALDGTAKWVRVTQRPEQDEQGAVVALAGALQDITEIVALRSEAETRALRLENTIENMPDPYFLQDRDFRFTYANSAGRKMLASALAAEDWLGRTLWDVLPSLEPQLRARFEQMLDDGQPVSSVVAVKRLGRTMRIDAHLTLEGIGLHARDVTREHAAQQELAESEERYRLAYRASQDVLFDWNIRTGELKWSDIAKERFGYDPAVFPRSVADWLSIVHPDDRDRMRQATQASTEPGQQEAWTASYRILRADGSTAYVLDRSILLGDAAGLPLRMIGTITDVTAIREEEERLRAIVDVAADGIYEYDPKRNVMIYSDGMRASFGHDWTGVQQIPSPWLEAVYPEDREKLVREFLAFAASGEPHATYEYRLRRADGSSAIVRDKAVAMRDASGTLLRVVGSIEDVTLERHAEERMNEAARIESIGKLTGGVAHDFNNLLTVILENADVLETAPGLAPDDRELVSIIIRAAERGAELTAGLLAFAGKQPLKPKTLDMRLALSEIGRLLERTLPASIDLRVVAQPGIWLVEADPAQLNAAILNLAVNARDAMPEGGKLLIECSNARLDGSYVSGNPDATIGDFLRISVTDTGTGMAPDVVKRVFEPFFTTKALGAGTGMGLSMVRGFVRQSGGHVNIYTEPGQGTTISLYLPRSGSDEVEAQPEILHDLPAAKGEHVLIVEDNVLLLPHVAEMVRTLGYRVSAASDAAEALSLLHSTGDVDVLFTDVVMPGDTNGPALATKARTRYPGLKVLFTSGYTENAIIHHGRLDTGVQLLSKPYRRRDLALKLRQVLEEGA